MWGFPIEAPMGGVAGRAKCHFPLGSTLQEILIIASCLSVHLDQKSDFSGQKQLSYSSPRFHFFPTSQLLSVGHPHTCPNQLYPGEPLPSGTALHAPAPADPTSTRMVQVCPSDLLEPMAALSLQ